MSGAAGGGVAQLGELSLELRLLRLVPRHERAVRRHVELVLS